jgi:hypothetical protein
MVNSFTLQTAVVGGAGDDWYMYVWFMCMMSSVNDQRYLPNRILSAALQVNLPDRRRMKS